VIVERELEIVDCSFSHGQQEFGIADCSFAHEEKALHPPEMILLF